MNTDATDRQGSLVGFFQRHVVPILFCFSKDGRAHYSVITSLLLSVRDELFLVTAGHCIDDVQRNLDGGAKLERVLLIDSMGDGAVHDHPVPFYWGEDVAGRLFSDPDHDFGLVILDDITGRALLANGLVPLTEEVWELQPDKPDHFFMVGVPAELATPAAPVTRLTTVLLKVIEAPERPAGLRQTNAERWYGYVTLPSEGLADIAGMSGGPIFSYKQGPDGQGKYWLHAIQSAWHKPTRAIAACPTRPLGRLIVEILESGRHARSLPPPAGGGQ